MRLLSRGKLFYTDWWVIVASRSAPFFDPCETPHPTTDLDGTPIDVRIAPLVAALWDARVSTVSSCQGEARLDHALDRHVPNLSPARPYAATISVENLDQGIALMQAVQTVGGGRENTPVEGRITGGYMHVRFDPALLDDPEFPSRVAQFLRSPETVR